MTRKRLAKLLMGLGLSRNAVNYMADRYRRIGMPYIMGYVDLMLGFNSWSVADHWRQMSRLRSEVEKETGKKYRTFGEMASAMLRIAKSSHVEQG